MTSYRIEIDAHRPGLPRVTLYFHKGYRSGYRVFETRSAALEFIRAHRLNHKNPKVVRQGKREDERAAT